MLLAWLGGTGGMALATRRRGVAVLVLARTAMPARLPCPASPARARVRCCQVAVHGAVTLCSPVDGLVLLVPVLVAMGRSCANPVSPSC